MKSLTYLKISLFLSFLIISFGSEAKSEADLALLVAKQTGITQNIETRFEMSLQAVKNFSASDFNEKEMFEFMRHLKAHTSHMINTMATAAVKETLTISEMKALLQKQSLAKEEPFRSKLERAATLIEQKVDLDQISIMSTMVAAHHYCLKEAPKEGCPKTPYSTYPPA